MKRTTATKFTKTQDGYRWRLYVWGGVVKATTQQRRVDDDGRVYFRYCHKDAEFDTVEARTKFLGAFTAKQWATA